MKDNFMDEYRKIIQKYGFLILIILLVIGFSIGSRSFFTVTNILGIMHAAAPLMIMATGMALVVMTHNLDISIGSTAFLSSVIGSLLIVRYGYSPWLGIGCILLTGLGVGAVNGFLVAKLKVNSFIVTLGTMMALRGISLQILSGRTISLPQGLREIGRLRFGPVYFDIIFSLAFLISIYLIHTRTPFGRYIMAVGSEPDVSEKMGVSPSTVVFKAFLLSGLFAALGGTFSIFQLGLVSLRMGLGTEFVALAAIVIGGISLFGGRGSFIPGLLFGVYTLYIIGSGLNHLGVSPYLYPLIRGGIIFGAMYADSLRTGFQGFPKKALSK